MTGPAGGDRSGTEVGRTAPRRPALRMRVVVAVLSAVTVWVLWRTGPGPVPYVDDFEGYARTWPGTQTPPGEAYVLRNVLGPLLYQLVPGPGIGRFLQLHLVALLVTGALLLVWLLRRLGPRTGPVAIVLVLLSPMTALLLLWIGSYDAFSALAWVGVLVSLRHRPAAQVLAGLVAGAQNLEQVLVGLVLLALVPELPRAVGLRPHIGHLIGGAVAGRVLVELFLRLQGATVGSRLTFLTDPDQLANVTTTFLVMAPVVTWTVLGGLWGFALTTAQERWPGWSRSLRVRLVAVLVLCLGFSFLAADHTRVIVMILFPLVVTGCMALAAQLGDLRTLAGRREAWLLLLVPPVLVQDEQLLRIGIKLGTWGIGPF